MSQGLPSTDTYSLGSDLAGGLLGLSTRSLKSVLNAPATIFAQAVLTTSYSDRVSIGERALAFFNVRSASVQPDRRLARRYLVDCPARLSMAGGERVGRLSDLSEHGARFDTDQTPTVGTTGFLRWNAEDHYCKVIWSNEGRCGLQFERPIGIGIVEETCSEVEVTLKPIAAVSRIRLGQRRGRNIAATEPEK